MPRLTPVMILFATVLLAPACSSTTVDLATPTLVARPQQAKGNPTQAPSSTPQVEAWRALDLRYAHVLDVTRESLGSSQVRFDVTLVHDDDGESPQYADWWQVEDLSGNTLGVRVLTHSHGTQPFTRSTSIEIPPGVETVIIRGHDMLHGFGGQVVQLDLKTGEQEILTNDP